MLPHTGLFLLGKVALQMRIRRPFYSGHIDLFTAFFDLIYLKNKLILYFFNILVNFSLELSTGDTI